jgi:hypothetical protein
MLYIKNRKIKKAKFLAFIVFFEEIKYLLFILKKLCQYICIKNIFKRKKMKIDLNN